MRMFSKKTYRDSRWVEEVLNTLCVPDGLCLREGAMLGGSAELALSWRQVKPSYNVEVYKHPFQTDIPEMLSVGWLRLAELNKSSLQCLIGPNDRYRNGAIVEICSADELEWRLVVYKKDIS